MERPLTLEDIESASSAPNTIKAYAQRWNCFVRYCKNLGLNPESASVEEIVGFFLFLANSTSRSGDPLKMATIKIQKVAMKKKFVEMGRKNLMDEPKITDCLSAIARIRGTKQRRVKALREFHILKMINKCGVAGADALGLTEERNKTLLLVGFAGAMRRSEIIQIRVEDIEFIGRTKMKILLRNSKTDQEGKGQVIPFVDGKKIKPVAQIKSFLKFAGIESGFVFQTFRKGGIPSGKPINQCEPARIVKRYCERIGLDPAEYSGHSLRAGFVTSAAINGARIDKIMDITRHKSSDTLMRYIRDTNVYSQHASSKFF